MTGPRLCYDPAAVAVQCAADVTAARAAVVTPLADNGGAAATMAARLWRWWRGGPAQANRRHAWWPFLPAIFESCPELTVAESRRERAAPAAEFPDGMGVSSA